MVNEYLRQMQAELSEARAATAMAMADDTRLRSLYEQNKSQADDWQQKAELAVQNNDDDLAKEALLRKATAQKLVDGYYAQWQAQDNQVNDLRDALAKLEAKINEADAKRQLIIAKQTQASTQEAINTAVQTIQSPGIDGGMDQMEQNVDDRLAKAQAVSQLQSQDLDSRFSDLETQSQVNSDLAALKQKYGKQ